MGVASTLEALARLIDPREAYWSVIMHNGRSWSEHSLVPTLRAGQKGARLLDWGDDLVSTGDVKKVHILRMHCPNSNIYSLEIPEDKAPFQFKIRSLHMLGDDGAPLEAMVIGRADRSTGECDCFIWDYRKSDIVAYQSSIFNFGSWRDSIPAIGALSLEVQGFRI